MSVRCGCTGPPTPSRRSRSWLSISACNPEALRGWIRQAEADAGERDDRLTTDERAELVALREENAQLKRANDVMRTASAFFAAQLCATRRDVDREVVKGHFRQAVVAA
ncbi:transposase [Streptomyces sp. NPDC059697]|uniref:transposase n=1 Tax=Streptomyces sp. NPDC059697 TaxID=3346912 RepID=UPI0036B96680